MRRRHLPTIIAMLLLCLSSGLAQRQSFEVSSVRLNTAGKEGGTIGIVGGRFVATNVTLKSLITYAYATQSSPISDSQLLGLPNWASMDHFDIQAKPEGNARIVLGEQTKALVQSLLEDRFALKLHREERSFPVYNLVVKGTGLKLSADQTPPDPRQTFVTYGSPGNPEGALPRGAVRVSTGPSITTITGTGVSISRLVTLLRGRTDHVIVDRTNFNGLLDISLEFTREFGGSPSDSVASEAITPSDSEAPSLFTAIQRIGLKLELGKGPLAVLVIDSLRRPSGN